jgi:hypothetical protein
MSRRKATADLRALEGRSISLSLVDGSRIDDCQLVSAGRHRSRTIWIFADGQDRFVPIPDVVDVWEAVSAHRHAA